MPFDCVYLQQRTSFTRAGLWRIVLMIVAQSAMVFVFQHDLNAQCGSGRLQCAAVPFGQSGCFWRAAQSDMRMFCLNFFFFFSVA